VFVRKPRDCSRPDMCAITRQCSPNSRCSGKCEWRPSASSLMPATWSNVVTLVKAEILGRLHEVPDSCLVDRHVKVGPSAHRT